MGETYNYVEIAVKFGTDEACEGMVTCAFELICLEAKKHKVDLLKQEKKIIDECICNIIYNAQFKLKSRGDSGSYNIEIVATPTVLGFINEALKVKKI